MSLITTLKDWNHHRFLKKHGCRNQQQYDRMYDPLYTNKAKNVKDIYHGYPYVVPIEMKRNWFLIRDSLSNSNETQEWCKENCKGKWRNDFLRVLHTYNGWEIDGIAGADVMFYAFQEKNDYLTFILRWQ